MARFTVIILGLFGLGLVTGALPGPPLSQQGRYLVEVYDSQVLESYVFRSPVHLALLAAVIGLAASVARRHEPAELQPYFDFAVRHERVLVALLAGGAGLFSLWIARGPLGGVAHVQDERAYLFQARLFADGRLAAPVPPPPLDRAMQVDFTVQRGGRWFGRFPPGWPAVLSVGVRAGAPWAVNPLLTVLVVAWLHAFVRRRAGAGPALATTALIASSPLVTILGGSSMSHPFALVLTLAALYAWERAWGLALGLSAGALLLTRPHEGALLGLAAALHCAAWRRWGALAGLAVGGLACAAVNARYNVLQTGDAWLPPTLAFFGGDRPGFFAGAGVYVPEGHNLWRGLHNLSHQVRVTGDVLFGWPFVSLVPALIGLAVAGPLGSLARAQRALALGYLGFLVVYHNPGFAYGTRFHYALLPALATATAVGLQWLGDRAGGRGALVVSVVLVYLTVVAWVTHYPRRIAELDGYWRVWPLEQIGVDPRQALVVPAVQIDGVEDAFSSFEAHMTPWPGGAGVVAAREGANVAEALQKAFPERPVALVPKQALLKLSTESP